MENYNDMFVAVMLWICYIIWHSRFENKFSLRKTASDTLKSVKNNKFSNKYKMLVLIS